ncbi:MAG: SIR2 family protein [Butyrivibrio sp.]|nr:SIR2 family protein [Butyrivibrio sp.]
MDDKYWINDKNFIKLCDIVALNRMVCLTGAGISEGLPLKNGKTSSNWLGLLTAIKDSIGNNLSKEETKDVTELLSGKPIGEQLIEASSILYNANKKEFLQVLKESADLANNTTSDVHKALLELSPRGILTYNYDVAHENAINEADERDKWSIVLPFENDKIADIIRKNFTEQFLFKAHGTVDDENTMVLTRESYRELFNNPYYKAFMQYIFTNFQLLIIGFGLSDPDFDMLLQNIFSVFGSPIQEHIVIKHKDEKTKNDTLYRLRYGLNFIYVNDFGDIPEILRDSTKYPGDKLKGILNKCIDRDIDKRKEAHQEVRSLSNIGMKCLENILKEKIMNKISREKEITYSSEDNTETSEYVYTYGVIANMAQREEYKDFLIEEVINKSQYSEPIAHALVHLRDILTEEDIKLVEEWKKSFVNRNYKKDINNTDPDNRVYAYCETAYYLLKAKYKPELV